MKQLLTIVPLLLLLQLQTSAQSIANPATSFVNSGLYTIQAIHRSPTSTIIDLKISFIPGWWTKFDKDVFLQDADSQQKFMLDSLQGAIMGKELRTPKSGDTTIHLFFPALPPKTKLVNFGESSRTDLYGISLENQKKETDILKPAVEIEKWMQDKIAAAKSKKVKGVDPTSFFEKDSVTIVGYIKGYDTRSGFSSGIVYHHNAMTNENHPTTIQIKPDGRFEVSVEAFYPIMHYLAINGQVFPFYIEPGHTLGMTLDWQDFLLMDRYRNRSYTPRLTVYSGPLSDVNQELLTFPVHTPDYKSLQKKQQTVMPTDFSEKVIQDWDKEIARIKDALRENPLLPLSEQLIYTNTDLHYANYLFDYTMSREYYSKQDTSNAILKTAIPPGYHDFVNRLDLHSPILLTSREFTTFINRIEYSPLYPRFKYNNNPDKENLIAQDFMKIYHTEELPLMYHVIQLRELKGSFDNTRSDSLLRIQTDNFLNIVSHPVFSSEVGRLHHVREKKKKGYTLPNTHAANTFKNLITPHQGKILIVDFWAQWCGPCRAGIEQSLERRKLMKDHPHLDFVFITDESGTPDMEFFNEYTEKNFMKNSYRVTADEYLAFRELFSFNGIPRYVLVDADGSIRNDDFSSYNLVSELKRYFPDKFADLAY